MVNQKVNVLNNKTNKMLSFPLEDKAIVWLSSVNKYIVVQPPVDEIIKKLWVENDLEKAVDICEKSFDIQKDEANKFVNSIVNQLQTLESTSTVNLNKTDAVNEFHLNSTIARKHYKINDLEFTIEYETPEAQELIHPKFSYAQIDQSKNINHRFKIFHSNLTFSLLVDGKHIGTWSQDNGHFLGGKVSMEILQKLYHNEEKDWIGVFHAAGVSNGKKCLVFLGDSGNGKSTLSALLMANGFDVLADDFLPMENQANQICRFPSALSVKKQALDLLAPIYPSLKSAEEHYNAGLNKTFRYLPQINTKNLAVPCKALVFVKYKKDTSFKCSKMHKQEAFEKLVCDSWLSPDERNVIKFVKWFKELPCYQLTYSDNEKMISFVKETLDHE